MTRERRRTFVTALSGLFLLGQLLFPLYVARGRGGIWRDFSWDMFSHGLRCRELNFRALDADGAPLPVDLSDDFGSFSALSRVLMPDRLERYAQHLCAKWRVDGQNRVTLHISALCSEDRGVPARQLADPLRDYCAKAP